VTKITIRELFIPAGLNVLEIVREPSESPPSRKVPRVCDPRNSKNIDQSIGDRGADATLEVVPPGFTVQFEALSIHLPVYTITMEEEGRTDTEPMALPVKSWQGSRE
jgi:hypothetical protein